MRRRGELRRAGRAAAARAARPLHVPIVCTAPEEVARERFAARAASGERHPGHLDGVIAEELAAGEHDGRWGPLDLDGELLVVDTAETVDVPWLAAAALAAA